MNEIKVHERLAEWFLDMGFPPDKIPPQHSFEQLCRGEYYKVWRNMMRHVHSKQEIRAKRMAVFSHQMQQYEKIENSVHERLGAVVLPETLTAWKETKRLELEIAQAEKRLTEKKNILNVALKSLKNKCVQRENIELTIENHRRRTHLLKSKCAEMSSELTQLREMCELTGTFQVNWKTCDEAEEGREKINTIVQESLQILEELYCRSTAIDKNAGREQNAMLRVPSSYGQFNCTSLSNGRDDQSVISNGEYEKDLQSFELQKQSSHEKLSQLLQGLSTKDLWQQISLRQMSLVKKMAEMASEIVQTSGKKYACNSALSAVANSSALHCTLAMDSIRNRAQLGNVTKQFAHILELFSGDQEKLAQNGEIDIEARIELFVLKCEEAKLLAKRNCYQQQCGELMGRRGVYRVEDQNFTAMDPGDINTRVKGVDKVKFIKSEISELDKQCLSKKSEIDALLQNYDQNGSKIIAVQQRLSILLQSFLEENTRPRLTDNTLINPGGLNPPETGRKGDISVMSTNYDEFLNDMMEGNGGKNEYTNKKQTEFKQNEQISSEKVISLYKFYQSRCSANSSPKCEPENKELELSLNLDQGNTNGSLNSSGLPESCDDTCKSVTGRSNRLASDEIMYFVRKFELEKNRKLVLDSGESLWIYQTLNAASQNIYKKMKTSQVESQSARSNKLETRIIGNPAKSVVANIFEHVFLMDKVDWMKNFVERRNEDLKTVGWGKIQEIDLDPILTRSEERSDKIKKKLHENLVGLHKTGKTLKQSSENMNFWTGREIRHFISERRLVSGKPYPHYEKIYVDWSNNVLDCPF